MILVLPTLFFAAIPVGAILGFLAACILSGDTNSDPLPPVLIPTPIMPSCYRLLTPPSGSFLIFTSVS